MGKPSGGDIERMRAAVDKMATADTMSQAIAALLSLILLAAIGVGVFFLAVARYAPMTGGFDVPTILAVIAGMWLIGLVIGYASAQNPALNLEPQVRGGDAATAGCLIAVVQFLGGGIYGAARAMSRGGDPNGRERHVASVLLAAIAADPGAQRKQIEEAVHAVDSSITPPEFTTVLRWLESKSCVEGVQQLRLGPGLQNI